MNASLKIFSNYEYKKCFFPAIEPDILTNNNSLQVYTIQQYLKDIIIPVQVYRTSFYFLIYVIKGFVQQQIDDEIFTVNEGSCIHVKQGNWTVTHAVSEDAEGYVMLYEDDVLTQYLLMHGNQDYYKHAPFLSLDAYDKQAITATFILLDEELKHPQNRSEIYLPIFNSVLSRLNHYALPTCWSVRDMEIVYRFKQLVQSHHIHTRSVLYYARQMAISENYLNKCVKKATGKSAKQWITEVSIGHSMLLLRDMTQDIAEIAYHLNFQSPSYFARLFKKTTGQKPKEYRLKMRSSRRQNNI